LPANASNKWTPEEDETLRNLVIANASIYSIAAKLKRSVPAIKGRAHVLGLPLKRVEGRRRRRSLAAPPQT
jgi:hypothetical protein